MCNMGLPPYHDQVLILSESRGGDEAMGPDHGEAVAFVEPPCDVVLLPDIEIDIGRLEPRVIEGGIHQPAADPPVLEVGEDIDPAQLLVLRRCCSDGNPHRPELYEADQPARGLGEQEDVLRHGLAEIAVGEIALEMGREIARAEAMPEGVGISPARQAGEGGEIRVLGSPYRHALPAGASQAALRQRPSRISSSVTARMLVPRMSTI